MKILKNIIIYVFVFSIIFSSFKIPDIILKIENANIEKAVYEKVQEKNIIDVEAEKIYLVKAIHDIESEYSIVEISPKQLASSGYVMVEESTDLSSQAYKEIEKLKENNIIENFEITDGSKCRISLINRFYETLNNKYNVNNISIEIDENRYELQIEGKTGKILNLYFKKENINKEEVMRNYVQYLDLYIIDDWKFENDMLKSEKAKLMVDLLELNNGYYILSIHSSNKIIDVRGYENSINTNDTN